VKAMVKKSDFATVNSGVVLEKNNATIDFLNNDENNNVIDSEIK
jgi:hypothetical protein